MKYVIIECDNAITDANNMFPVFSPLICRRYGKELKSILHSKTEDGKGPADVPFATAMRHV